MIRILNKFGNSLYSRNVTIIIITIVNALKDHVKERPEWQTDMNPEIRTSEFRGFLL